MGVEEWSRGTFSHEGRDGHVEDFWWHTRVVGHRVVLHVLKRCELHNSVDDLVRHRQVQVLHDCPHYTCRILG